RKQAILYAMNNDTQYLSKEKHQELQQELIRLKTIDRKEVAQHLEDAKALGDLSENAEYHEARERQADIEDRISQIEDMLKNAVIVSQHHSSTVEVGSSLTVKKEGASEMECMIVGTEEANSIDGKISHQSPLGMALMGHKAGDTVVVATPKGPVNYTIVKLK
ncbi:MAG TPA: transcription elongation factor GreA, partial [Candidatus Paceibacterota bacterium]|nr:transcription elongation factor GreA [Candidatus Paceibacterota bacterium]